jgi:hypothetical protein
MLKNSIIQECIGILKREDVKNEVKTFVTPVIDMILVQIYPYLYLCTMFVVISFLLHLGIFILLFRNKTIIAKTN